MYTIPMDPFFEWEPCKPTKRETFTASKGTLRNEILLEVVLRVHQPAYMGVS